MMNVSPRLLALLVAVPALASCDPSLTLIEVRPDCPDMPLRGPADYPLAPGDGRLIDDFEDGDLRLAEGGGLAGSWVGFVTPTQGTVSTEWSGECVANGRYSGHFSAVALQTFAANWNGVFLDPFAQARPFDATAYGYTGFSFWVAAGVNAQEPLELPIGLMTRDTSGGGGVCGTACADYYRVRGNIKLTRTWTRHVVTFSELAQIGQQGAPQQPLNRRELVSLMIWPERTSDIWIDDVRFER